VWDHMGLQCLLQCEIVKSGHMVADSCEIIVGLGKMCNRKIKILNCKVKLLHNIYRYKN
jgi:hypothetical protein